MVGQTVQHVDKPRRRITWRAVLAAVGVGSVVMATTPLGTWVADMTERGINNDIATTQDTISDLTINLANATREAVSAQQAAIAAEAVKDAAQTKLDHIEGVNRCDSAEIRGAQPAVGYTDVSAEFGQPLGTVMCADGTSEPILFHNGAWYDTSGTSVPMINNHPLEGQHEVSSDFGPRRNPMGGSNREMHDGIDYGLKIGTRILAAAAGVVTKVDFEKGGAGNYIVIQHANGYETKYFHLQKMFVKVGDRVNANREIALSGNTGRSTAPHVHVQLEFKGRPVDPLAHPISSRQTLKDDAHARYMAIRSSKIDSVIMAARANADVTTIAANNANTRLAAVVSERDGYATALNGSGNAVLTFARMDGGQTDRLWWLQNVQQPTVDAIGDAQLATRTATEQGAAAAADWAVNTAAPAIAEHVLSPAAEHVKTALWNPRQHPFTIGAIGLVFVGLAGLYLRYFGWAQQRRNRPAPKRQHPARQPQQAQTPRSTPVHPSAKIIVLQRATRRRANPAQTRSPGKQA